MLSEIDFVTKYIQNSGRSLSECRDALDSLIDACDEDKSNPESKLFGCRLGKRYISPESSIVLCPAFEKGVVKIQKGLENTMTESEKIATSALLKKKMTVESKQVSCTSVEQSLKKRQKVLESESEYIDSRFVLGSSAECERLFSMARYVFCENCRSISPLVLESILFLKLNERFWDIELVSHAINTGRTRCTADE